MSVFKTFVRLLTGFRKFTMGIIFIITVLVLLGFKQVDGALVVTTLRDVVVAFMATNVCAKIIGATQQWLKKKK